MRHSARTASAVVVAVLLGSGSAAAAVVSATGAQAPRSARPGESVPIFQVVVHNYGLLADSLESITFQNTTLGAGTSVERDLELGTLSLVLDDGDGILEPSDDVVGAAQAVNGQVRFVGLSVAVPMLDSTRLFLADDVALLARDGDELDLRIGGSSDVHMAMAALVSGSFPIDPPGTFPVDGMSGEQVVVHGPSPYPVVAGANDQLVLDVTVPANGYAPDRLQRLELVNLGTAGFGSDLTALRLFADDGDGVFEPASDATLGALGYTGAGHWTATALNAAIPVGGLRLFVAADAAASATKDRTIRLALPSAPDVAFTVESANDGPVDQQVALAGALPISTADRVTLTAASLAPEVASPGASERMLLDLIVENAYGQTRTLSSLRVTNATLGNGTTLQRDAECARVTLRIDGDDDGRLGGTAQDPVVGVATFSGGRAEFNAVGLAVPANGSRHLFVVADLATDGAADGDSVTAVVADAVDVGFQESTRSFGSWPLDSHSRVVVDGMVRAQIHVVDVPSVMLGPNDGPTVALAVRLPTNGYRADTLAGLAVVNHGSAGPSDLADVRLWRDGGDGRFGTPGDDRDLGALSWDGAAWTIAGLSEPVDGSTAPFWISVATAANPSDSATVSLALPVAALAMRSDNDGPRDGEVDGRATLVVSNAPLLGSWSIDPRESVVGQGVSLRLVVRNSGVESVTGIVPDAPTMAGIGGAAIETGPTPASFDLAPGASDAFTWTARASAPGDVSISAAAQGIGAVSGQSRRSLAATSSTCHVYVQATSLDVQATGTMPLAVARGAADVSPLLLTFTNPGAGNSAPVEFRRLVFRLEDVSGGVLAPGAVLSRARLALGATVVAEVGSFPDPSQVALDLPPGLTLAPGANLSVALRLDLSSAGGARDLRVALVDVGALIAYEAPTARPIPVVLQGASYPFRTGSARIVTPATELTLAAEPVATVRAARGQADVPLLAIRAENAGTAGVTSDVRWLALALRVDSSSVAARPIDLLARLRATVGGQTLAIRTLYPADDSTLILALSPGATVRAGQPLVLEVRGDVAANAPPCRFRVGAAALGAFEARDVDSGADVTLRLLDDPFAGPTVRVETVAESLLVSGTSRLGGRIRIGDRGVTVMTIRLCHPGGASSGRIRMDSLMVRTRDGQHHDLAAASVLNRVAITRDGIELASTSALSATSGHVVLDLGGLALEAGDTTALTIVVDVAATAPEGAVEFSTPASGVFAVDANTGRPATVFPEPGAELPLVAGPSQLAPPARELRVSLVDRMPAALALDGRDVLAGILRVRNPAAAGGDTIAVQGVQLRAAGRGRSALAIGSAFQRAEVRVGSGVWASSAVLTADSASAWIEGPTPLAIPPGETVELALRLTAATDPTPSEAGVGLDSSGVVVLQPSSALLRVEVRPEDGEMFPLWTQSGAFEAPSSEPRLSNFPNPFAPPHGATTFVYYLRTDARVTIRLFTLEGDLVGVPVTSAQRSAGLQQADGWDGRNGRGSVTRNGVYVAELVAEFADGSRARALRKVGVVR